MESIGRDTCEGSRAREGRPLERVVLGDGIVVWQSIQLREHGVNHAFTTRHGGDSTGIKATLDLAGRGSREGADLIAAESNVERLRRQLGVVESDRTLLLHQVHGTEILVDEGAPRSWPPPRADILISNRPDGFLMVRVADCVPILLHDPPSGAVAAIHSGWRGTVADAPGSAVQAMIREYGAEPGRLIAAIGPAIGVDHFEVGEEVARAFKESGLGDCVRPDQPRPHVDLHEAVRTRLLQNALEAKHIDGNAICSHGNTPDCFSYRRDGPDGGRMAAVIQAVCITTLAST
jgi:YfiH family protein